MKILLVILLSQLRNGNINLIMHCITCLRHVPRPSTIKLHSSKKNEKIQKSGKK